LDWTLAVLMTDSPMSALEATALSVVTAVMSTSVGTVIGAESARLRVRF
jgi:hypothetical protein